MATLKAAKEALDHAVTAYKCSKSVINRTLTSKDVVNERTLNNKMKSLNDALSALNIAHTSWVSKGEFTEEQLNSETYSNVWLENEWLEVSEIQDRVDEKLPASSPPVQPIDQKLVMYLKQMESLELDITSKIENLQSKIVSASSMPTIQVYSTMISELKDCFAGEFNTLAEHIMTLDVANAPARCQEFENYRRSQKKKIADIEFKLAEKSSIPSASASSVPKGIEMEKSKAPSFSGKTIDYPEFKKGWQKVPGVMWEDSNQVEQIKFKVDSNTRRIISRCNTMSEVWDVLDSEFAQEQEVINAVDQELRKLRSEDCSTPQYVVNLRNYLPCLEEALKSVNGLEHLCSPDRVHYLTAKFDERTMYDWELYRPTASGTTYKRFFDFLVGKPV